MEDIGGYIVTFNDTAWLEKKYIPLLCSKYKNYRKKSYKLYNFSCPVCGDSEKNPRKARGYVYEKGGKFIYHCHNCGITPPFLKFLKEQDPNLYSEFLKEKYVETCTREERKELEESAPISKQIYPVNKIFSGLKKVSQLQHMHPAKKYVDYRRIPTTYHHKLYFVPNFMEWTNSIIPGKFNTCGVDESRLVIPFFTKSGEVFGYQGRIIDTTGNISNSNIRYITILLDTSVPRLFGMDSVDLNRIHYVLEGPIDSMFIPNSMASAGGDIVSELHRLGGKKENTVIFMDNEPRKKETVQKIQKALRQGFKVSIWPDDITEKDVNAFVMRNKDIPLDRLVPMLQNILVENTYSGLSGELRLSSWSKV